MIVAIVISIVFGIFVGAGWGYILGQHKYDADFNQCYNCPYIWCDAYPGSEECLEWRDNDK